MKLLKKAKKLKHDHLLEITAFCGGATLLLLGAGFIAGGRMANIGRVVALNGILPHALIASIFPCSWNDSCPPAVGSYFQGFLPTSQSITTGQPATLYFESYTQGPIGAQSNCFQSVYSPGHGGSPHVCNINPNAPDTTYTKGIVINGNGTQGSGIGPAAYVVSPTVTTIYYFCSADMTTLGYSCLSSTVTVISAAPTVTIDAGAGNGVTRNVTVGTPVTISGTFTPAAGDTITQTSLVDYQLNALPGINTNVPPTSKSYVFTPNATGSYIFYPSVQTTTYPAWNNYSKSVTVVATAPPPTCTLNAAPNAAATGSSITLNYTTTNSPTLGTIKDASNNTIITTATNSSGGVSATAPSSPGNYTYAMTVSNPSGSGSCQSTLQAQADVCTDIPGLQASAPASPCVTPVPSPGSCVPSGYVWSGSACVVANPSITAFSGPTRVRHGSTATLTYNVTNPPASCSVTGTNGFNTNVTPTSGVAGQVTTTAITGNTRFTMTCGAVSQSINVGSIPVFQEQ